MTQRLDDLPVSGFLGRLATADPVPGGGSASALAGSMAAALVQMVVALTSGRPAGAEHEAVLGTIGARAGELRAELLRLAEVDAEAYAAVVAARRLPKDTEGERATRQERIDAATREATRAPLEVAQRSAEAFALAESLAPIGNRHALSDVGVAGVLAAAAVRGAAMNVEINLPSLPEGDGLRGEARAALESHLTDLDRRERALTSAVGDRIG